MAHRRKLHPLLTVSVVVLSVWPLAGASGAPRPPAPKGVAIVAAGKPPHVCTAADTKFGATGYGPVSGYYYSPTANAWLAAPYCYPQWGNLEMSGAQIGQGGGRATVVATPNQGSNSAEWATKPPGAITWQASGTPVKGSCLRTTLTCTVVLPAAGPEWQWLLFTVSLPRTYFIDSPGEFCAGQHACAGTATNGWTYVGIPPKGQTPPKKEEEKESSISGRVVETDCSGAGACKVTGLPGVSVTASGGPGGVVKTSTGDKGNFSMKVDKGTWTVTPTLDQREFDPPSVGGVSVNGATTVKLFRTCALARKTQTIRTRTKATDEPCDKLEVDWKMPKRLFTDNSNWGGPEGLPPASYVSPKEWQVDLFLAKGGKSLCPAGVTFEWSVKGNGKPTTLDSHGCTAIAKVPELGTYSVTARELKSGKATGTEAKNAKVVVRDWLFVGMGDSNGSGQANPPYINLRCDRSIASYQYQTAQYVEDHDPHTSVTFVFDSCSGARSDQLWKNTYVGQEPSGGVILPPQIDQVRSVIGKRKPDALIMSIGINDLFFGAIMGFCATYNITGTAFTDHTCESVHVTSKKDPIGYTTAYKESADFADPTVAALTAQRLDVLPSRLASLAQHLPSLGAKHIFASHYPDFSTDEKGQLCSDKKGPFPKLSSTVWGWLRSTGSQLNAAVGGTSKLGWIPIDGIAPGFVGHGYCSTASYFQTPLRSQWEQANRFGAFHALKIGADISFGRTRDKVCAELYGNPLCDGTVGGN